MTKQEFREILASGGLSLLFAPKDKRRDEKQAQPPERGNGGRQGEEDPARRPKARTAG